MDHIYFFINRIFLVLMRSVVVFNDCVGAGIFVGTSAVQFSPISESVGFVGTKRKHLLSCASFQLFIFSFSI